MSGEHRQSHGQGGVTAQCRRAVGAMQRGNNTRGLIIDMQMLVCML